MAARDDATLLTARWVVGHENGRHCLYENGEVVFQGDRIVYVGPRYPGAVARRHDYGRALIGPGFVDLDALSDLDTTILGFDNSPAWRKGRIWPDTYMRRGPYEMYTPDELAFQKRYAFAQLIRNGITTALPIASLFYRVWGETRDEFLSAARTAGELGLRVYLGPAYRSGHTYVNGEGRIRCHYDAARGMAGLEQAMAFADEVEGLYDGRVRAMLSPDRIETCTPELLRASAAAARARHPDPPALLPVAPGIRPGAGTARHESARMAAQPGLPVQRALLPHGTYVSGSRQIERPGQDLEIIRDGGATVVHCPLVSARHGATLESFARYRKLGVKIGMGTDTWPPDMVLNMQVGMMLCRVMDQSTEAVRSEDYYDAATLGGADALGRADLGRLAPGAKADIVVFDFPTTATAS
ncbi:chlorohydrolase family protein [Achromobacter insuavis]